LRRCGKRRAGDQSSRKHRGGEFPQHCNLLCFFVRRDERSAP
jgi:hypothetical protein